MPPVLLLDVDGTLIEDRGYRHALVAAAQRVCQKRGLPTWAPTDHEINVLHACGYSNEWDSVPFTVGINMLDARNGNGAQPDFSAWAVKTKDFAGLPNERARDALLREAPPALHRDLHTLLDDVRDPRASETTRLLYNFVLGSALFEQHYEIKAEVETPSLLETLDVPMIDDRSRDIILNSRAAIYTARPSLPPQGRPGLYQTPEAEIAARQLKLEGVPLVGLGPMQWLVDQFGGGMWDYAKPAPTQPIAAMLAAAGVPVGQAALAAYSFQTSGVSETPEVLQGLDGATVHVFEDNAGGVRAAQKAAALLAERGVNVHVVGYGIAKDEAKRAALAEVCEQMFDDVNTALGSLRSDIQSSAATTPGEHPML
jgi:hypothetical protein